jgi:hypothetical protein
MITLKRVTGQTLVLEFGGTGGLSKATLDEVDVTKHVSFLKQFDHSMYTDLFGFTESVSPKELHLFSALNERMKTLGLFIQKVQENGPYSYQVYLCEASLSNHVLAKTTLVADYNTATRLFCRIGQCFDPVGVHSVPRLNSAL